MFYELFAEDVERITDAWIFINFITKNEKIIERQLEWDEERGLWKCECRDSGLEPSDAIEYWIYKEQYGVGYFSSDVVEVMGELRKFLDSYKILNFKEKKLGSK